MCLPVKQLASSFCLSLPAAHRRFCAKDLAVKRHVIIPPIHVARNVGRGDRDAQDFLAVRVEQCAQAALEAPATFEVFPSDVNLTYSRDKQSLVVRVTEANGVHREVTADTKFTIVDPTKAKIEKGVVSAPGSPNTPHTQYTRAPAV